MSLSIQHHATDMSYNLDGNSFDIYRVLQDGVQMCMVHYDYGKEGKTTVTCEGDAALIDECLGAEHLIASVNMHLLREMSEDASFYHEAFYDDSGLPITHAMSLLELM